ncbi:MAG TPA: DUF4352 domain-containing protein [Sporosarcina psychrophila]|uniref:DUF4352 domain-containing protein n=1 Tax=Sporosarcina psychrophila TaxID=1476 RepID=A0A921G0H1_SPOPS|nr:DUF4352 domain-containing protein [Sporosarcina psychrophila]
MKKLIGFLFLSMILILTACGSDTPKATNEASDAKPEAKEPVNAEKEVSKNLKIGDSATIDDVTVTINKVAITDERNEFEEVTPERAVLIDFTVENNTDADYPVGMDFSFYVDGKKVESMAVGNVTFDAISAGRSMDGQVAYPADGEKLELEFKPMMHIGNEKYIFDIEL